MKISEVKPGAGIELHVELVNMGNMRKTWKCFECKKNQRTPFSGCWEKEEDFQDVCPTCDAKPSTEKGKGVWIQKVTNAWVKDETGEIALTLWNDDIDKYKVGDKLHLISGYAINYEGKVQVSKGKYGVLEVGNV